MNKNGRSRKVKSRKARIRQSKKRRDDSFKRFFNQEDKNSDGIKWSTVNAPISLSLKHEYVDDMLEFVKRVKKIASETKFVKLHLKDVKYIGEGGIAMLLSVMTESLKNGTMFQGLKPTCENCKAILERSGFYKLLHGQKNVTSDDITILTTGSHDSNIDRLLPAVHKAMETIWGSPGRCPILVGGIGEMMRNSIDHAYREEDPVAWHLSVSHFKEKNTVKFSFVDNGVGIIERYSETDKPLLNSLRVKLKTNHSILKEAYQNGIKSRTGLSWRGTGLPTIYEMFEDNVISNLVVITNNCYLDFERDQFEKLSVSFSGTYYYWTMDKSCIDAHYEN